MSEEVVRVEHDVAARQYEVYVDDRRAGLSGQLRKRALDDAKEEGLRVVPRCSYVANHVERHEEYADQVQ